jgi:hypothetical protein
MSVTNSRKPAGHRRVDAFERDADREKVKGGYCQVPEEVVTGYARVKVTACSNRSTDDLPPHYGQQQPR